MSLSIVIFLRWFKSWPVGKCLPSDQLSLQGQMPLQNEIVRVGRYFRAGERDGALFNCFSLEAFFTTRNALARRNWFHRMFPKGADDSITWLSFTVHFYASPSRYSSDGQESCWLMSKPLSDQFSTEIRVAADGELLRCESPWWQRCNFGRQGFLRSLRCFFLLANGDEQESDFWPLGHSVTKRSRWMNITNCQLLANILPLSFRYI